MKKLFNALIIIFLGGMLFVELINNFLETKIFIALLSNPQKLYSERLIIENVYTSSSNISIISSIDGRLSKYRRKAYVDIGKYHWDIEHSITNGDTIDVWVPDITINNTPIRCFTTNKPSLLYQVIQMFLSWVFFPMWLYYYYIHLKKKKNV